MIRGVNPLRTMVWISLLIRYWRIVQTLCQMFGLSFTGKFHPSFNVSFPTRTSMKFLSAFANSWILFNQINSSDFTKFGEQRLDLCWSHSWRNASDVQNASFLKLFVEVFSLGQGEFVDLFWFRSHYCVVPVGFLFLFFQVASKFFLASGILWLFDIQVFP